MIISINNVIISINIVIIGLIGSASNGSLGIIGKGKGGGRDGRGKSD